MNTIENDKYSHITHDPAKKFLHLTWLPATAEMTVDDFKQSMIGASDIVLAKAVESVLVDVRGFQCNFELAGCDEWRVENIVPKYNKVLKRFAWMAGAQMPQLPGGGEAFQKPGENYQSRWFYDEAAAIAWATADV
jgi:hypothetical protein